MDVPATSEVPTTSEVPQFAPVRVRGGRFGPGRLVRHRRRALAAGLALTAAALVAAGPRAPADSHRDDRARGHPATHQRVPAASGVPGPGVRERPDARLVTAPVRIADAATVRLLRPGDRVDVIAAAEPATGSEARVIARGVRVTEVPEPLHEAVDEAVDGGALVVLSVPRATAARLVGAGATERLAVTLC
ncbi:RcpC/CpaB family pilus assembly protein [Streptomyces sp. NPDC001532]|uniref:RcpC/CpaB family pilus assembly protein n=1 Tax=Streptomyces sp. NPDC001532 TaxID=3154520 RepID=UPI00332ABB31